MFCLFYLKNSHKVDIIGSKGALTLIDKEAVLSPYPGIGSILPILATNKGDIYNAAILNGYGDMVDRLAQARGIELQHSIGNANRDTINILKIFNLWLYLLCVVILRSKKNEKEEKCLKVKKPLALWNFNFDFCYCGCLCGNYYSGKQLSCI